MIGASSSSEQTEEEEGGEEGLSGSHLHDQLYRQTIRVKYFDDSENEVSSIGGIHHVNKEKVLELCKFFKGTLISSEEVRGRGGNDSWQFKCSNGHEFVITTCKLSQLSDISLENRECQHIWCLKCRNFHSKCVEKAKQEDSEVISDLNDKSLCQVKCSKGHTFFIKYSREISKVWCKQCKQAELFMQKQANAKAQQETYEKLKEQQQKIFSEASCSS